MRDRVFFRMHVHNLQNFVSYLKVFLKQKSTTWGVIPTSLYFQEIIDHFN